MDNKENGYSVDIKDAYSPEIVELLNKPTSIYCEECGNLACEQGGEQDER